MKRLTGKNKWSKRIFAGILALAMIATSFSGDIQNLVWAEGGEPGVEDDYLEPGAPNTDPGDPSITPSDPVTDPSNPVTDPSDPGVEPSDPVTDPSVPVIDPADLAIDPSDPAVDPSAPGVDPSDPVIDPSNPGTDPSALGIDPSNPVIDPLNPGTDPVDPLNPGMDPVIGQITPDLTIIPSDPIAEPIIDTPVMSIAPRLSGLSGDGTRYTLIPGEDDSVSTDLASPDSGKIWKLNNFEFSLGLPVGEDEVLPVVEWSLKAVVDGVDKPIYTGTARVTQSGSTYSPSQPITVPGDGILVSGGQECELVLTITRTPENAAVDVVRTNNTDPWIKCELNEDIDNRGYGVTLGGTDTFRRFFTYGTGLNDDLSDYTISYRSAEKLNVNARLTGSYGTEKITYKLMSENGVSSSGNDGSVVNVDDAGFITPKGPGDAVIRASVNNGQYVEVTACVRSIRIDQDKLTFDNTYRKPVLKYYSTAGSSTDNSGKFLSEGYKDCGTYETTSPIEITYSDGNKQYFTPSITISPLDLTGGTIDTTGSGTDLAPSEITPSRWAGHVLVTVAGLAAKTSLTCDEDFTVEKLTSWEGTNGGNLGTFYDLRLTGKNNYTGSITLRNYFVEAGSAAKVDISKYLKIRFNETFYYTGGQIKPGSGDENTATGGPYNGTDTMWVCYGSISPSNKLTIGEDTSDPSDDNIYVWRSGKKMAKVVYEANKDCRTGGWVTLVGVESEGFTGEVSKWFQILSRGFLDIPSSQLSVTLDPDPYTYKNFVSGNGNEARIDNDITVTLYPGMNYAKTLTRNVDYTLDYENNRDVGRGVVKITGISPNFATNSYIIKNFTITGTFPAAKFFFRNEDYDEVVADDEINNPYKITYDGDEHDPDVVVKIGNGEYQRYLAPGYDYKVEYLTGGADVGEKVVKVTGLNDYSGQEKILHFWIAPKQLPRNIVINANRTFVNQQTPALNKSTEMYFTDDRGEKIVLTTNDYDLVSYDAVTGDQLYADNSGSGFNAGSVRVIATGKGNYTGTASGTYEIKPADLDVSLYGQQVFIDLSDIYTSSEFNNTYTGKEIKIPSKLIKLFFHGVELDRNRYNPDVVLKYSNNIDVGTATITFDVDGMGLDFINCNKGDSTATFTIAPKQIDNPALEVYAFSFDKYDELRKSYGENLERLSDWGLVSDYKAQYVAGVGFVSNTKLPYKARDLDLRLVIRDNGVPLVARRHYNVLTVEDSIEKNGFTFYYKHNPIAEGNRGYAVDRNKWMIQGINNYSGPGSNVFVYAYIEPKVLKDDPSSMIIPNVKYDENTDTLSIDGFIEDKSFDADSKARKLRENYDYVLVHNDPDGVAHNAPGTHEVIIRGTYLSNDGVGNYTGEVKRTYKCGTDLAKMNWVMEKTPSKKDVSEKDGDTYQIPYCGVKPRPIIDDSSLSTADMPVLGTDYNIRYSSEGINVNSGAVVTVTIEPIARSQKFFSSEPYKQLKYAITPVNLADLVTNRTLYLNCGSGMPDSSLGDYWYFGDTVFTYDGSPHSIMRSIYREVTDPVTTNKTMIQLLAGTDYYNTNGNTVDFEVRNAGDVKVNSITGMGNYVGEVSCQISIAAKSLDDCTISVVLKGDQGDRKYYYKKVGSEWKAFAAANDTVPITVGAEASYTGNKIEPNSISIFEGREDNTISLDNYTVTYGSDNKEVGTDHGVININHKSGGNFVGDATLKFNIVGTDDYTLTVIDRIVYYTFNDAASPKVTTPEPAISIKNRKNEDIKSLFDISYYDKNKDLISSVGGKYEFTPGKYYVLATPNDPRYTETSNIDDGAFEVKGRIQDAVVGITFDGSNCKVPNYEAPLPLDASGTYEGEKIKLKVTCKSSAGSDEDLTIDTDYKVSWPADFEPGTTKNIVITGMGDYTGSFMVPAYAVIDLSHCTVDVLGSYHKYNSASPGNYDSFDFVNREFDPDGGIVVTWHDGTGGGAGRDKQLDVAYYTVTSTPTAKPKDKGEYTGRIDPADSTKYLKNNTFFKYYVLYNLDNAVVTGWTSNFPYMSSAATEETTVKASLQDSSITPVTIAGRTLSYPSDFDLDVDTVARTVTIKPAASSQFIIGQKVLRYTIDAIDMTGRTTINFRYNSADAYDISPAAYNVTYNYGTPITPDFQVVVNGEILKKGENYTYEWKNNINAGTASLTVTGVEGKGYIGSHTVYFNIKKINLGDYALYNESNETFTLKDVDFVPSDNVNAYLVGKPVEKEKLVANLTVNGNLLVQGTDYTVDFIGDAPNKVKRNGNIATGAVEAHTGVVEATGTGNYEGVVKVKGDLKVLPIPIATASVQEPAQSYYNSEWQPLDLKVYADKEKTVLLRETHNYNVTVTNTVPMTHQPQIIGGVWKVMDRGDYQIKIDGVGNYTGSTTVEYKIIARNIESNKYIRIEIKDNRVTPAKTYSKALGNLKVTPDSTNERVVDYEALGLTYPTIDEAKTNRPVITVYDTHEGETPAVEKDITDHCAFNWVDDIIGDGADHSIANSPHVVISARDEDYTGEVTVFFSIGTELKGHVSVSVKNAENGYTYDGITAWKPGENVPVEVKYTDPLTSKITTLVKDQHYRIVPYEDTDFVNSGIKQFYIVGMGGYYGTIKRTPNIDTATNKVILDDNAIQAWYYVNPKPVTGNDISITLGGLQYDSEGYFTYYTGSAITPSVTVRDKRLGLLTEGVDYNVNFDGGANNTDVTPSNTTVHVNLEWLRNYVWNSSPYYQQFRIKPIKLSKDTLTVQWDEASGIKTDHVTPYNDDNLTVPTYTVRSLTLGKTLSEGMDYTIDYEDPSGQRYKEGRNSNFPGFKAGDMYLVIKGKGNYDDQTEVKERYVIQADLENVDPNDRPAQVRFVTPFYTGEIPILEDLEIHCGGNKLNLPLAKRYLNDKESNSTKVVYGDDTTDFKVTFTGSNSNQTGTVLVTSSLTAYKNSLTFDFETESSLNNIVYRAAEEYPYTGQKVEPEYHMFVRGEELTKGVDAEFTYYKLKGGVYTETDPIEAGDYYYNVKLTLAAQERDLEYSAGNPYFPLRIVPRSLSDGATLGYPRQRYYTGAQVKQPYVNVYYNGKKLVENQDYEIVANYDPDKNIAPTNYGDPAVDNTGSVTVRGINNFTGYATDTFAINPSPANGLAVKKYTADSIRVGWVLIGNVTGRGDVNDSPKVEKWHISYKPTNAAGAETVISPAIVQPENSAGTNFYDLTGLNNGTEYDITVWSEAAGKISQKFTVSGKTSVDVKPLNVTATQTDGTTARISWRPVPGAAGYEVTRSNEMNGIYRLLINFPANKGSECYNRNLKKGMTYYYMVRAYFVDANGDMQFSQDSEIVSVTIR